jgi:hypothetical protein
MELFMLVPAEFQRAGRVTFNLQKLTQQRVNRGGHHVSISNCNCLLVSAMEE